MRWNWQSWTICAFLALWATLAVADSTTTNLLLTDQTTGGNPNTWGDIADENFDVIDEKLGDVQAIATTGGTTTLTSSQEIVSALNVSGTLVSNSTIEFSGRGGFWIVRNNTSGSYTVTVKATGQTGFTVDQGNTELVYCCVSSDLSRLSVPTKTVGEVFAHAGSCPALSLAAYGQAISRSTYDDLFSAISTTYGVGDNVNTFNLPDLRGKVIAGQDDMGGSSANRLTAATADTLNGDTLGATGGVETQTIAEAELPAHVHSAGTYAVSSHTHGVSAVSVGSHTHSFSATTSSDGAHTHSATGASGKNVENGSNAEAAEDAGVTTSSNGAHTHTVSGTTGSGSGTLSGNTDASVPTLSGSSGSIGSGTALGVMQPTIVLNMCIYTGV